MKPYDLSAGARQDLDQIWEYIARDSIDAADRALDRIHHNLVKLAEMPRMGHTRPELRGPSLRVWRVYSYLMIYRPESHPLEVVRVLSGYRDLEAMFES